MSVADTIADRTEQADASSPIVEVLRQRYGADAPDLGRVSNEVLGVLLRHRSIRAYLPKRPPPGTVEAIIAAAQSAASSSNLQTWSVVVVEDEARKARLAESAGAQQHIREAPLFLVWLADLSRAERIAGHAGRPIEALRYFETFLVSVIDAALAAQNAVIALESLGLGAVYIGAIRNQPRAVAAELALPPHVTPVFGLCVGYPDPATPADIKPRLRQAAVVHRERYNADGEAAHVTAYDALLRRFQDAQALPAIGWTEAVLNRLGTVAALKGRDRLVDELRSLGYELE